jgi:threonine synthase
MDAKALIDASGIGCEPASACSLAGTRKLVEAGIIQRGDSVVGILTGHVLKDPEAIINYHSDQLPHIRPAYPTRLYESGPSVEELSRILLREPANPLKSVRG